MSEKIEGTIFVSSLHPPVHLPVYLSVYGHTEHTTCTTICLFCFQMSTSEHLIGFT
ncbi:hypothetical protein BC939DRAFT_449609 [Gamsiella multidivaricata]|uniref:uncharacterized protein n=1 Tax=Gamsiella multidivaricata TaxID=101098 RepID=UPI002220C404|nr:uncharacterized protein BC939DRAFT_449609 [Gamsiella multidivaricata]KAI7824616.1 hypothetical protein BC939DRAFT_449609 [Gamsiella multidivaricata]